MNGHTSVVNDIIKKRNDKQSHMTEQSMNGNALIESLSKEQTEILLKEYELCTIDANHLEDSIWTATSILMAATVAGIGILSSASPDNIYKLVVNIGISVFSVFIVHIWYRLVFRWHAIQSKIYFRSEDIEKYLRYIRKNQVIRDFLNNIKKDGKENYTVSISFEHIRFMLMGIWILFSIVQVAWYIFQVTGFSDTISWLSIK